VGTFASPPAKAAMILGRALSTPIWWGMPSANTVNSGHDTSPRRARAKLLIMPTSGSALKIAEPLGSLCSAHTINEHASVRVKAVSCQNHAPLGGFK